MTKHTWILFGWGVIVLALINYSIYQKEQHLANGTTICLALAPVDPRSLMQGDYMALRFALSDTIQNELKKGLASDQHRLPNSEGRVLIRREDNCTATFISLFTGQKMHDKEIILRYRVRKGRVHFSTDAFFFQEGTADRYESARYGVFKINAQGEPLLTELKDTHLMTLGVSP
jgi:uncharacterized membrane-anchored protein